MQPGLADLIPNKKSAKGTEKIVIFVKFYAAGQDCGFGELARLLAHRRLR